MRKSKPTRVPKKPTGKKPNKPSGYHSKFKVPTMDGTIKWSNSGVKGPWNKPAAWNKPSPPPKGRAAAGRPKKGSAAPGVPRWEAEGGPRKSGSRTTLRIPTGGSSRTTPTKRILY